METKRIKLLKPYQLHSSGSIQEFPASIADLLIQRNVAEEVKDAERQTVKEKKPKNK